MALLLTTYYSIENSQNYLVFDISALKKLKSLVFRSGDNHVCCGIFRTGNCSSFSVSNFDLCISIFVYLASSSFVFICALLRITYQRNIYLEAHTFLPFHFVYFFQKKVQRTSFKK